MELNYWIFNTITTTFNAIKYACKDDLEWSWTKMKFWCTIMQWKHGRKIEPCSSIIVCMKPYINPIQDAQQTSRITQTTIIVTSLNWCHDMANANKSRACFGNHVYQSLSHKLFWLPVTQNLEWCEYEIHQLRTKMISK